MTTSPTTPPTERTVLREGFPPGPPVRRGLVAALKYYGAFAIDPIGFVGARFARFGDIYYAPSESGGLYVVKKPEHVHEVLSTRASSFGKQHTAFKQLSIVLGDGLLIAEGERWKRHRRMINPGFAPARIAAYADVMADEARRAAASWTPGEEITLEREMTQLTLRIVSRTLFGHDVSHADIETIAGAMFAAQRSLAEPDFLPSWIPIPGRRALERSLADLDRIVYRLIRERRAAGAVGRESSRGDLLQLLVDAVDPETPGGHQLTEREVRDELVTMFLAGHETTSQALTWAFYCLARSAAAEQKLHRELDDVLGDREPTLADLEQLPYTEQVMQEAMRLYPPVFAIARRAHEDTEIGGWSVPAGSEVIVWLYWTHRDPTLYPDPETFRPERFTKDAVAARPKSSFLPFGAGPRACIGRSFAMMEARLILATLAQRHRLLLTRDRPIAAKPRITLTPKRSVRMRVTSRG